MTQYLPRHRGLMFIDETSKDERTQSRRWGRAKKSCRACMRGPFVHRRRFTVIAALTLDGVVAGHVVDGSLRRNGYLHFLQHSVVNLARRRDFNDILVRFTDVLGTLYVWDLRPILVKYNV
jgi:hypothetical protein